MFLCNKLALFVLLSVFSLTSFSPTVYGQDKQLNPAFTGKIERDDVPQYLQDVAVTIKAGRSQGSGVLKVTKDGQVWVWTCGHVVEHLRQVQAGENGKSAIVFTDAEILRIEVEDGRRIGSQLYDAEVIRYSHAEKGEDLALLRLRSKRYKAANSVRFYLDAKIPPIGTDLCHCGSLLGEIGANSFTAGPMSQHGRVLYGKTFDQVAAPSFPGSSGGVVCLRNDGRYVGMVVRGAGETFTLTVPVRRMMSWAKRVGVDFTMDDTIAIPTEEKLRNLPVDDSTSREGNKDSATHNKDYREFNLRFPFRIFTLPEFRQRHDFDYALFDNILAVTRGN